MPYKDPSKKKEYMKNYKYLFASDESVEKAQKIRIISAFVRRNV